MIGIRSVLFLCLLTLFVVISTDYLSLDELYSLFKSNSYNTVQKNKNISVYNKSESAYRQIISAQGNYQSPHWTWECVRTLGHCRRLQVSPESPAQTQGQCSVWCGPHGGLWPRPTGNIILSDNFIHIDVDKITHNLNGPTQVQGFIKDILDNFKNKLNTSNPSISLGEKTGQLFINIMVTSSDLYLKWDINEGYSLNLISSDKKVTANIKANTVFGVRHALETLTQLTAIGEDNTLGILESASIEDDQPVYTHRGLLLDTARHFLPWDVIKRQVEAMATSKMNVLHWHITDSHSFPMETPRVPLMMTTGAYGPKQVYRHQEIKEFIEFARKRGVRVILELDAPSHTGFGWQWGPEKGLGDLAVCINQKPWRGICVQPPCGQLNPANPHMYNVLSDIYADILDLVPDGENIHMGGDEIHFGCWNSSDEIIKHQENLGRGRSKQDFLELWGDFQTAALNKLDLNRNNSEPLNIMWTSDLTEPDVIKKYLDPKRYVIQPWLPASNEVPEKLLNMGYRLIMATKDAWYLDHGFWGSTKYYLWPVVYGNKLPNHKLVLGGEVCMWGEYVDEAGIDARIWPRAAAAAERLWSNPKEPPSAAEVRLSRHRQRLLQQGVMADPILPQWCEENEGECK